jgi:hypothetical protein
VLLFLGSPRMLDMEELHVRVCVLCVLLLCVYVCACVRARMRVCMDYGLD